MTFQTKCYEKNKKMSNKEQGNILIEDIIKGADRLLSHFDRDGLDHGLVDIRDVGKVKYLEQGKALQHCLSTIPEQGRWLKNYVEVAFSQYFGAKGQGSVYACFLNIDRGPRRLRTELECFKTAMVIAKNYIKENPQVFSE